MLTILKDAPGVTIHEFPEPARPRTIHAKVPRITPPQQLYQRPGFLLRRAHQLASGIFEDEASALDLTPAQFGVLTLLHSRPAIDQTTLARALGFDKVTTLRVLRVLEARGLLERLPARDNRRKLAIHLTMAGGELLGSAQKVAERAIRRLLAPLDAAQQAQLLHLLQVLTSGLEHEARAPWVRLDQTDA